MHMHYCACILHLVVQAHTLRKLLRNYYKPE